MNGMHEGHRFDPGLVHQPPLPDQAEVVHRSSPGLSASVGGPSVPTGPAANTTAKRPLDQRFNDDAQFVTTTSCRATAS